MEMIDNISQPEIKATDLKTLKKQKKILSLGLSGLIIGNSLISFCLFSAFVRGTIEYLITGVSELPLEGHFYTCFVPCITCLIGIITGSIAIMKAKKLKKVGNYNGKAVAGNVLAIISCLLGTVRLVVMLLLLMMLSIRF